MGKVQPLLSVVIACGNQRYTTNQAIQSIIDQNIIDQLEVLVVDCAESGTAALESGSHPRVRIIPFPDNARFESALVEGIKQARAPVVALLEEHCIAHPGWAEAMVGAHKESWGAVCGEVINGNPGLKVSDAELHACREIRWQSPARRHEADMLDGHNSSYKRNILLSYGDALADMVRAEAVLLMQMRKDGYKLLLEPAAKYTHLNEAYYSSIRKNLYYWHRCFGHARAEVFDWSLAKRLFRIATFPLLPWRNLSKDLVNIIRTRRDLFWNYIKNAPMILLLHYHSAFGQAIGIAFGIGNAAERFTEGEMETIRVAAG